jgi:hypothetical protein
MSDTPSPLDYVALLSPHHRQQLPQCIERCKAALHDVRAFLARSGDARTLADPEEPEAVARERLDVALCLRGAIDDLADRVGSRRVPRALEHMQELTRDFGSAGVRPTGWMQMLYGVFTQAQKDLDALQAAVDALAPHEEQEPPQAATPATVIWFLGGQAYQVGNWTGCVSVKENNVLQSFLKAKALTGPRLRAESGEENPVRHLRTLKEGYKGAFRDAIRLPGRKSSGGYVVDVRRRPT